MRNIIRACLFFSLACSLACAQQAMFIADQMPTKSCHASTIVEIAPGEFLAAWFGGTAERNPDVAIYGSRYAGGRWSAPQELVREPEIATWNPVLFRTPDGFIWLYYKFGPSPSAWTAGRLFSRDGGRTWSSPEHLPAGLLGPIRAKPLLLPGGTILSGSSVESYTSWACWIERSTDNGKTWTRHGPVTVEGFTPPPPPASHGIIQPVIVPLGEGRLRLFARATRNIGRICYADSLDGGITWTPARATALPNPSSGIDAVRLSDGRIILIYNHSATARTPLNLAASLDGERWLVFAVLENAPGQYSYPAMILGSDGDLHITYTWKREHIKYVHFPARLIPTAAEIRKAVADTPVAMRPQP